MGGGYLVFLVLIIINRRFKIWVCISGFVLFGHGLNKASMVHMFKFSTIRTSGIWMPRQRSVGSPVAPGTLETFATLHTHMHPQPPLPVDATTPLKFLTVDDPVLNCSTDFLAPDSETILSS